MRITWFPAAFAVVCLTMAACSGGGSTPATVSGNFGSAPAAMSNAVFTITIPNAVSGSSVSPKYISASTKSVKIGRTLNGVVQTSLIQNVTPGSPNCTTGSSGTTCTIAVAADVGSNVFTVTAYDALNALGNQLSSGSVAGTVVAGQANSFPLTMGGTVASVSLVVGDLYPPVGTSTSVQVQAKDAGGNTIIGTYDAPVTLSVPSGTATLSSSSFSDSSGSAQLTLTNSQTAAFALSASVNGKTGTATITPSSGIIAYSLSGGPNDEGGLHVSTGTDGKFYYTTGGAGFGGSGASTGNIGQFDPATGNFTEITSSAFPFYAYQTKDGAVWVATSSGVANIARIAGAFSQANYADIVLPLPTQSPFPTPRSITDAGNGFLYMTSNLNYLWKVPIAGPYTTGAISTVAMPSPGPNIPRTQGIATGPDGNVWIANDAVNAGSADIKYTPSSGALVSLFTFPLGQSAHPRYMALAPDGFVYQTGLFGGCTTSSTAACGAVNQLSSGCSSGICETSLSTVDTFSQPDDVAAGSGKVAYVDLWWEGIGVRSTATGDTIEIPIGPNPFSSTNFGMAPEGVTVAADGSIWFITFARQANGKIAMGRLVFTSAWSIWPSKTIAIQPNSSMLVAVVEAPDTNSGPFTATSSNTSVCGLGGTNFSHDAHLISGAVGSCAITITDARGRSDTIAVTVTTSAPSIAGRQNTAPI